MAFSHGDTAFDFNAVLIVNDAVQDAFGDGTAFVFGPVTVNTVISVIYVILGTENQRPFPAAGIDQFQKIIGFRFGKRPEKPFVYDQQVKSGISLFNLVLCMSIPGDSEPPFR